MKGSKTLDMSINIGGEILKLKAGFKEQEEVRDTEYTLKQYYNKLKREWPDSSDRQILAMTAFQFCRWYKQELKIQEQALELATQDNMLIDKELDTNNLSLDI